MAEILKEWLTERLQRPITWDAEDFGKMMRNGYVIAGVLLSYHVINEEQYYMIRSSNAQEDIKSNWKYLKEWLRELEVNLSDNDLESGMEGTGTVLLRLFYQLFLHLDKKDRIDYIKREKKMVSSLVTKMGQRFQVNQIEEKEEPSVEDLSRPLVNEKHFIEWQRKKAEQVKETYDYIRYRYSKMMQKVEESKTPLQYKAPKSGKLPRKDKVDMERFSQKYPCKAEHLTYEKLLELEAKAAESRKSLIDSEWAQNYMDNLYTKMHKKTESEEFQKQMRNVLSSSLWEMSVNEEENKLDTDLAKKVMKLSQFEKQMCTQIMETKQQARNLFQNRVQAQNEYAAQRTHNFNQFLDNMKEKIHLEVVEIDFEKQRQEMLHKKLYAEKMKRKRQHYYEICYDTMLAIVDFATRYAYFKKLIGDEIPEHYIHEWKILYFKHQPIFEILESTQDLLKETALEEEILPEVEEIIRLELERQEAMNDSEFLEYHNYSGPWNLDTLIPNFDPESEEQKYEYLGLRILGHVVYTLLEIKYPYPPPRPPADLPDFASKALVRNLPDKAIAVAMQTLLDFKKIHVVRLESAINMCLRKFKYEMVGCTDIELSFDKFVAAAQEDPDKELIKLMKAEDETFSKSSESNAPFVTGVLPPNTKQTQTPKTIPEEDIKLSPPADLGKYAYEMLSTGDSLTDHLLAAMLVEYIKDQENINGFAIINYPNSYREAQILEETFSGRAPPDEENLEDRDDIYLEETIAKHRKKEKDQYKEVRVSKLVNDPHKKSIHKPFESYFTCYINLKETEDILQEVFIWDYTEENSELIDRFYSVLGMNYSMYYEVIEKDLLAQICQYIIGDYLTPLKSLHKLFGENVLSALDFPTAETKRTKSKIVKTEVVKSKDKMKNGSKTSRLSMGLEEIKESSSEMLGDETLFICEGVAEEEEIKSAVSYEEVKILAGEEDWDYGNIPFAEMIGIALATCWEQVEKMYIHDMKQLFFAIRLQMNCLIPYTRFIKDKMEQIITLPSHKQDLVSAFQKEYNEFENDWRDINLTKNEWHCRIKELQIQLYNICDKRKLYAEQQRLALIMENWAMEELTSLVNSYVSCMQVELNRSILTFQAFHDFYFCQLKRLPPNDRLSCKDLTRVYRESDDTSGSKRGGEDKVFRQLRLAFLELQLKDIQIDYSNNPLNSIVENNVKFALKVIKDTNDSYRSLVSREYTEYAKITPVPKRKEEGQGGNSDDSICSEEIFKQNALKCIDEWTVAINGEMFRAMTRILALQYKCYRDMKLFNDQIYKTFMEVQNSINNYYINEIKSVDRLCKYLQMAIENGRRITESLILEHDTFLIDPNLLQFSPPAPPSGPDPIGDYVTDMEFKLSQLARLRSQFKIVAPTGIVLQQAFIYLLQDFIFFGKETCEGSLVPEAWKQVDPEQVSKLAFVLFGETSYIDWRDFLIYCLNLRYPTVDELLAIRHNFRSIDRNSTELIGRDDFIREELWFERDFDTRDPCAQLRKNLIKNFLFELYESSENMMNYSAFLLAFCKNPDPIEGFTSALSVAVGKKTCSSIEECEEVVCKLIKQKQYRDACYACALKCTQQFLDKVIASVVDTCEGTTVEELEYVAPVEEKGKGKKGKGATITTPKSKKLLEGSSQSARMPKQKSGQEISKTKVAQSATDVKTTYICRPCEGDEVVEEKPQEKEEVEEEQRPYSPQEDPNLAYAVSQQVIWNVLRICLPWHFELIPEERVTPYVCQISEVLKRLEVDTDSGDIYVCRFVAEPDVCKLLHKVKKFTALNVIEEVQNIML